jgi:toxin ParE1/3/4
MAKIIWSQPALSQLDSILDYIALDNPEAARVVASRVFGATDHLGRFLLLGRPIPGFARRNYRQVWIKPCWLYYRIHEGTVLVLHVRRAEKLMKAEDLIADDPQ